MAYSFGGLFWLKQLIGLIAFRPIASLKAMWGTEQSKTTYLMVREQKKKEEVAGGPTIPFEAPIPMT